MNRYSPSNLSMLIFFFFCQTRFTSNIEVRKYENVWTTQMLASNVFDMSKKFNIIGLNKLYLFIFKFKNKKMY